MAPANFAILTGCTSAGLVSWNEANLNRRTESLLASTVKEQKAKENNKVTTPAELG